MNIVRSLGIIVFTLLCSLTLSQAVSANQLSETDCGSFSGDQAAAQEYFEMNGYPESLDGNGDGQACASPEDGDFTGGPSAGNFDEPTCGTYVNDQAAAQEYFDTHGQPAFLDGNGDGIACADPEDGDFTGGPTAGPEDEPATDDASDDESNVVQSLPVTGSGTLAPASPSSSSVFLGLSLVVAAGAFQIMRLARR